MGLGSGILDPGSGSRGQKGTGSRIQIRNTEKMFLFRISQGNRQAWIRIQQKVKQGLLWAFWRQISMDPHSARSLSGTPLGINQCCGSGMFIPDPGSRILIFTHPGSRIPDPKTATKERGEKKLVVITFYVATKISQNCKLFQF